MIVVASHDHELHDPREPVPFAGRMHLPREVPARGAAILRELALRGFDEPVPADPVAPDLLARVHHSEYLRFLQSAHTRWCERTGLADGEARPFVRPIRGGPLDTSDDVLAEFGIYSHDNDPVLAGTWRAALSASECAVTAAERVLAGRGRRPVQHAYALCRPPGHHASTASFGGYCYLNNAAMAAQRVLDARARVAILDVDAHAANGTAQIFYERDDVMVVSVHADPSSEYPFFGGRADQRGTGAGVGFTHHLPIVPGADWVGYEPALGAAIEQVVNHGPDVVVVSLGVDTQSGDGVFDLYGEDFGRLGHRLGSIGIPLVLLQEGGYDLSVLGTHVANVLEGVECA